MSDTNLTQLIVNHLTRDELHNADFTGHGNELFVQSDHAGVSVGGVGVDALDATNITNCITGIPQDIKLELNAGTLTLKAGSKVYVPNGAGVFDEVLVANDITTTNTSNDTYMVFANNNGTAIELARLNTQTGSGTTTPTTGYWVYYNETDNKVYRINEGVVARYISFPICIVTVSGGAMSSIDQVFNGFGYIGSHVFFLPGYSVLTPNGRNADGTLANRKYTFTSCAVYTRNLTSNNIPLWVRYDGTIGFSTGISYDPITNQSTGAVGYAQVATATLTGGVISNFVPKQVFHAVDYSNTEFIAHQAMPSDRYTNLTLPATAGTITAVADGYLTINKSATAAGQYVNFINGSNGMNCNVIATSALPLRLFMPVSKGDVITINYDAAGTTTMFRFIYANGAK